MHLTNYTDYSLRVLLYLVLHPNQRVSIQEISDFYNISKDHLVKIVHHMSQLGYIKTTRGQGGGIQLSANPQELCIGEVVRNMEPHFHIVECFNHEKNQCQVTPICHLKEIFHEAMDSFLQVLDQYTLSDLIQQDHIQSINPRTSSPS